MLHKTLKYFRTSHKMTQETLALKLGVTRQTVSKWENGISVPDADTLAKIANIFEVTVGELLGADELLNNNKKKSDSHTDTENKNEELDERHVAKILAVLNEQLAVKNKHRKTVIRIIKIVLIVIAILISVPILYSLFWMYIAATM